MIRHEIKYSGFKRYANNTAWLILDKIVRLISSLAVGVWLTRHLGTVNFGILAYSQSFVAIFASIATLGLDSILTRELVTLNDDKESLLGTTILLKFVASSSIVFIILLLLLFSSNETTSVLILIISISLVFKSFDVFALNFQARVKSKSVAVSGVLSGLVSSILKIAGILFNLSLNYFAIIIVLDTVLYSSLLVYFTIQERLTVITGLRWQKRIAIRLIKDSWPLLLGGLVVSLTLKIDQVIIAHTMDSESVGEYAAAVRISEAWFFVPAAIAASLFPAIINAKKKGESVYAHRIQKFYSLLTAFSLLTAVLMSLTSSIIIETLYGEAFFESASVLKVHVWAGIFITMSIANGNWLISENLQKYYLINMVLGASINVVLNIILIPIYGIIAAAWVNLITYFISSYLLLAFFKETRISFIRLSRSFLFLDLYKIHPKDA